MVPQRGVWLQTDHNRIITEHFSGPSGEVGPVCNYRCICVRACVFGQ